MPIQILPAVDRKPSGISEMGQALAGIGQAVMANHKKRDYSRALEHLEHSYADNPEQQKLIKTYRALADRPEIAQQLTGQLSRLGAQQQKSVADRLKGEQEQKRFADSFQNIQNLYDNPELSEEQKIMGVYKELSQNPTLAHNLLGSLQKPMKARGEDIAGEQFSRGYDAILGGDNATLKEVLQNRDTPLQVKKQLTDLQNQFSTRKDVQARELRNRQSLVQKSYRQAIESERKRMELLSSKEAAPIQKNIKRLEALQKADLKKLAKNPDAYSNLHLWNHIDAEHLPEEEDLEGAELAMEESNKEGAQEPPDVQMRVEFLNSQFPPQGFKGKKKQDKAGRIYQSDGKTWRLLQQ